jgi:preprotein translocase subunit SecY
MGFLLALHSLVRWVIVILAVVAAIRFALVWMRVMTGSRSDTILMRGYGIVMGLQMLIGLAFLVWSGVSGAGFPGYRIGHGITMFVAVILANALPRRWSGGTGSTRARNYLLAVIASLVLVFVAVAILPGGWSR